MASKKSIETLLPSPAQSSKKLRCPLATVVTASARLDDCCWEWGSIAFLVISTSKSMELKEPFPV